MKNVTKSELPVYWRANNRVWMTSSIFKAWFESCFVPEVEKFLKEKNLSFKVLLLLDNATSHPKDLQHPNVQILFLPPNTNSLIQPLDQGVINSFNCYFIRKSFEMILDKIESNKNMTLVQAWKDFSILDCVNTISYAKDSIKTSTLNAC